MGITKEQFIKEFKRRLTDEYALDVKDATPEELYQTLAAVVKSGYSDIWRKTWKNYIIFQSSFCRDGCSRAIF